MIRTESAERTVWRWAETTAVWKAGWWVVAAVEKWVARRAATEVERSAATKVALEAANWDARMAEWKAFLSAVWSADCWA